MFRFIHAADFHLDSPFAGLSPARAAERRRESRELPGRLADYARAHGAALVLLAGDLFDSAGCYRETAEALRRGLGRAGVPVCIAPGNHDWYGPGSPYADGDWPENVHIFSSGAMAALELPALGAVIHGAAFTAPTQERSLLSGFTAPRDGRIHLGVLHGEADAPASPYDPLTRGEIAACGLAYLALGHIHRRGELTRCGAVRCAWPGCPEGRGFDELGEKGFYEGTVEDDGRVTLRFVPFARHRYESLSVEVTGRQPLAAVEAALPPNTEGDLCRIRLTGETEEGGVDTAALQLALSGRFASLELRDETELARDVWARAEEDSLRGLFLRRMRARLAQEQTPEGRRTIRLAVRFGLAALDRRDLG